MNEVRSLADPEATIYSSKVIVSVALRAKVELGASTHSKGVQQSPAISIPSRDPLAHRPGRPLRRVDLAASGKQDP